jgi:hypothetical protein
MASQVIDRVAGNYDKQSLDVYLSMLDRRFGKAGVSSNLVPQSVREFLAEKLMGTQWFAKNFVVERWFLHKSQAAMA